MRTRQLFGLLVVLVVLAALAQVVRAQAQQYYWDALDVDITVLPNSDIRVVETQKYVFTQGSFHSAYAQIPMNRIVSITDVSVSEGGVQYQPGSESPNTFSTSSQGGDFLITWYYPYTSNATRTFTVAYTVKGGLRFYQGGDQLWWVAVSSDRDFVVRSSQVTVHLPAGISPESLIVASNGVSADSQIVDGSTVVFNASNINPGEELEVRVQFPHDIVQGQPAAWQVAEDRLLNYNERYRTAVTLAVGVLGLLIAIAGVVGAYLLWYSKGRDMAVGVVADYLAEPPSDLPPGLVGTLVDEKVGMKDIVASIVDLGRRGVIRMTEEEQPGFLGIGTHSDFLFEQLPNNVTLRPYEEALRNGLFRDGRQRIHLSDLKERFYTVIPEITRKIYDEVVKEGLFPRSPQSTRNRYLALGIGTLVLGVALAVVAISIFGKYASTAFCPGLGVSVVAIALIVLSQVMPKKTQAGALAAASWRAFRRYLDNIEKYTNLAEAKDIFDKYLPYAIVFGLEREWVTKFARVDTPGPTWYIPYRPVIITGGGSGRGAVGGGPSALGKGGSGVPSLQGASQSMMGSLQSMSNGLFSMLNSASSTLPSTPRSSGSGGGWSRGGGRGGGWSGGGVRGGGGGGGRRGAR